MSQLGRALQTARPDSRSSQYSTGRFTSALSAAVKQRDVPSNSSSTEEQLEEVEQKITLTLQAIDANFDHCQRTMARDVMPKVERLARLSSDLLQASQPWLQFFMAVASADDEGNDDDNNINNMVGGEFGAQNERSPDLGAARRQVLEDHGGEITARFPNNDSDNTRNVDDVDETVDIDADIATPQLTSRFMTQELKMTTPRAGKRMAEQLSASIRKRARTTPMHDAKPRTPASMMRKLVTARRHPDSNASHVSRASMVSKNSSVGTSDLMPDTSPPHTTTFTLPKSRVAGTVKPRDERFGFGEDDDDDDILDEINSLIKRYDSPSRPSAKSVRSRGSVARSEVSVMSRASVDSRVSGVSGLLAQGEEMTQLADKYASPGLPTVRVPGTGESQRVRGLVADMEELLDEAEAVQASESAPAIDDFDDEIPSPPHIVSDLERPRVVAREISAEPEISAAPVVRPVSGANAGRRDPAPRAGGVRRTFGGRQISMDVEQMDEENMTIGHMSPLALRQQQQRRQTHAPRFASLQEADEDDPFGPTPPRTQADSTRSWTGGAPGERSSTFDATATFGTPGSEHYTRDSRLNDSGGDLAVQIDGTTTILPTREMLQQAAQLAEEGDSDDGGIDNGAGGIDDGGIDNGGIDDDDDDDDDEGGELVEFDAELFPLAFRGPPASLQLRELYDLARSQAQRLWSLDDLLAASSPALCDAGPSVLQVLLDLLARRRVLRQVGDNLWTAH